MFSFIRWVFIQVAITILIMYKYLVTCENRTVKIAVDDKSSIIRESCNILKNKITSIDDSLSPVLQMFDEDFKEYYEVEATDVPDRGKLLLSFL